MKKDVKDVFVMLSGVIAGPPQFVANYSVFSLEDPRLKSSVSVDLLADDVVKKLSEKLWVRCVELIQKAEG